MFLKDVILKLIFLGGLSFFWFIIHVYIWIEYCPTFICDPFKNVNDTYDYIVVGAGTAGSVVAIRLAEDKKASVLLLEAGPTGGSVLDIPAALPLLQLSPVDWLHETVPQKYAARALKNNVVKWPRGKLVGGSGRFNNMLYHRGHPSDYAEWYRNKTDYNYERDVLHYFKKSEHHTGAYKADEKHHGVGGPLYVTDLPFVTDLSDAVLDAARYLGYPVRDVNGEHGTGFMKPQGNLKNGARYSTGHYLLENKPKNLHLATNTLAEKLVFTKNFEASAIKVTKFGMQKTINAKTAIILTAGTIDTAKLLMLSGVGVKSHLEDVGVSPVINLPVGENLQDHITTGVDLVTLDSPLSLNPMSLLSLDTMYNYIVNGDGPWSSIQAEAMCNLYTECLNSRNFDECVAMQNGSPDLQMMVIPMGIVSDNGAHLKDLMGITDVIWDDYIAKLVGTPTLGFLPIVLHPKSKGYIKLKDNDPKSKPIIDPNYLSHIEDIRILLKGIQLLKDLISTPAMKKIGAKLFEKPLPGCQQHLFDSEVYWECYVRHVTLTVYHPVGTAKMGHQDDPSSVVGYDFRVIGANKLFVADASVMPNIPSGNTNAPTAMIAEKAAESVKFYKFLMSEFSNVSDVFYLRNICAI